jgi:cytochrome c oxidase subunit IV
MEHTHTPEYHLHAATPETYAAAKKEVKKVTIYLTIFTIIELILGYMLFLNHTTWGSGLVLFVKGVILIFMIVKAFYIVAYFMHLKHELKNMIMTIVVPLTLFIWFIIAFLADGNSYRNLNNSYDSYKLERSKTKVPAPAHGGGTHGSEVKHPEQKGH